MIELLQRISDRGGLEPVQVRPGEWRAVEEALESGVLAFADGLIGLTEFGRLGLAALQE